MLTLTDPFTGLRLPRSPTANMAWRKETNQRCESSAAFRRHTLNLCAQSPVFWTMLAGWTYHQKRVGDDGIERPVMGRESIVPFLLWDVQVDALYKLYNCIVDGVDAAIRKSRDMGASWLVVDLFQWYFQFRKLATFQHISASESKVDKKGDMDTLFEKHRWLMRYQPEWMKPRKVRDISCMLENQENGSTIIGSTTSQRAGVGGRKIAINCDEFAQFGALGEEIDGGTGPTCACRIFCSTPLGPETHYYKLWREFESGRRRGAVIVLPWWEHPDKGRGREQITDPIKKKLVWTSPWYRVEQATRSKRHMAQNVDMDDTEAADLFFDSTDIQIHMNKHCRPPMLMGNITFPGGVEEEQKRTILAKRLANLVEFKGDATDKPWRFWQPLLSDPSRGFRPSQSTRYCISADVARGTGASNSIIDVGDVNTGQIVAKYWDAFTAPDRLAEIIAFVGMWFGGVNRWPTVIIERNGAGDRVIERLVQLGWPNFYMMMVEDGRSRKRTKKKGWWSSTMVRERVLGAYAVALRTGTVINPCEEALEEAKRYVYDEKGKLRCGMIDEGNDGYATHGDHVIADALFHEGRGAAGIQPIRDAVLPGSVAWLRRRRAQEQYRRNEQEMDGGW